jgi:chromosome partitioning protein
MKVVSIINRKGGVGKTTTAYNLAFSLALKNYKVCLMDLDSQANLSLICKVSPLSLEDFKAVKIIGLNKQIDILPATKRFSILENEINNLIDRNAFLKTEILPKITGYDYLIIDTPPAFSILNINALCISDIALIIIHSDFFSISGLTEMIDIINQVKSINSKIDYKIILNNFVKNRKYLEGLLPALNKIENFTGIMIPNRQAFIDNSSLFRPSIDIPEIQVEYNKIMELIK